MADQTQSKQSETVSNLLYRLSSQWHIDPVSMYGKRQELEAFVAEVGAQRAQRAVEATLRNYRGDFCPSIGKIREYYETEAAKFVGTYQEVPQHTREDRYQHPDNYFGEADVVLWMRLIAKAIEGNKPRPTDDELLVA